MPKALAARVACRARRAAVAEHASSWTAVLGKRGGPTPSESTRAHSTIITARRPFGRGRERWCRRISALSPSAMAGGIAMLSPRVLETGQKQGAVCSGCRGFSPSRGPRFVLALVSSAADRARLRRIGRGGKSRGGFATSRGPDLLARGRDGRPTAQKEERQINQPLSLYKHARRDSCIYTTMCVRSHWDSRMRQVAHQNSVVRDKAPAARR